MFLYRVKKLHFMFFLSLLMGMTLLGCAAENKSQSELRSDGNFSAPLPKSLNAANVTESNLIVEIIIDPEKEPQDRRRLQNLVVDSETKAFSGEIQGAIPAGPHTFRLVFTLNDPIYGEIEVAVSGDVDTEVIANQDTPVDFGTAAMIFTDTDGDSRTNLEELEQGWDPKLAAPAAPQNISAIPGDQEVNLTWDAVDGAESYTVYWSDTGNVTTADTAISSLSTESFSHSGLANGTTYSYIISALGPGGEGLVSIRLNRIPSSEALQPPSVPSGPILTAAGNQEIELAWMPVPNVSYSIYRSTAPNVTTQDTRITENAVTPYTDIGLTNGTIYYYIITATSAGGESAPSVEVSDTPNVPLPAAPQGFTATPGSREVTLLWESVANVQSYIIYSNITGSVTTEDTAIASVTDTSFTHTGLSNGTTYYYIVTALVSGGESASSTEISVIPNFSAEAVQKLLAPDAQPEDRFGHSVSISGDYAIVGAPFEGGDTVDPSNNAGAAYIFQRTGANTWDTGTKITALDPQAGDLFGQSVSISEDYAIVGASSTDGGTGDPPTPNKPDAGAIYIFERTGDNSWGTGIRITPLDAQARDRFGESVSISGDYVIVGAYSADGGAGDSVSSAGAAYIFQRTGVKDWDVGTKIIALNAQFSDWFGFSVSINGDYAIVGAPFEGSDTADVSNNPGAAYIFQRTGVNDWDAGTKITAQVAQPGDRFGFSVSISGNYAIVGAEFEDGDDPPNTNDAGAAHIFQRTGANTWDAGTKITAPDAQNLDRFGGSVSISGDYAIVGAYWEDGDAPNTNSAGAAYIFQRTGTNSWDTGTKIAAPDAQASDQFGSSVSISGDYAIVGARLEDGSNGDPDTGTAYIY
ncbi:hypothetical protein MNBD_NITROSPIRAE01-1886 [hydrothermal vent metagenome]|uniref:Fibronectin type-III domain-containing protein n=1 Tax=hydrothermal vent metagenome TaxID=652676 RepID=A0A3B1CZS8_9ZZZZ